MAVAVAGPAFIFEQAFDLGVHIFDSAGNAVRYFSGHDERVIDGLIRCIDGELDLGLGGSTWIFAFKNSRLHLASLQRRPRFFGDNLLRGPSRPFLWLGKILLGGHVEWFFG